MIVSTVASGGQTVGTPGGKKKQQLPVMFLDASRLVMVNDGYSSAEYRLMCTDG